MYFDFVGGARENGRAAARAEKPPGIVACLAVARHRLLREHRCSVKKRAMRLAAVEAVTDAAPVWATRRYKSDIAAQTTTGGTVHIASPAITGVAASICPARPGNIR